VALEVLVEDVHARELLGAARDGAGVGFLPGVGAHVHDELHLGGEGFLEARAVGPLAGGGERVTGWVAVDVVVEDVLAEHCDQVETLRAASPLARVLLLEAMVGVGNVVSVVLLLLLLHLQLLVELWLVLVLWERLRGGMHQLLLLRGLCH